DILSSKKETLIVIVNPKYGNIKSKKDIPNLGARSKDPAHFQIW
ncbi:4341_t:CDS:2, partial [Gigaspora rosea]